uniref:Sulfotransferase domain-containing protein n=1 Tax=Chrysotila carterae TaxID=13221 RepID=A0A7S4EX06_CHRCT
MKRKLVVKPLPRRSMRHGRRCTLLRTLLLALALIALILLVVYTKSIHRMQSLASLASDRHLVKPAVRAAADLARPPVPPPTPPRPPVVPFVVVFESSSGSSWLMQQLATHPHACIVGFEPVDNISMNTANDHEARLRWLRHLWTPHRSNRSEWASWQRRLERLSIFGQSVAIHSSLSACDWRVASAFGLKARLSRMLSDATSVEKLSALLRSHDVRVMHLSRRNRIKQALAEYRRLHAGKGQFVAARAASAPPSNPRQTPLLNDSSIARRQATQDANGSARTGAALAATSSETPLSSAVRVEPSLFAQAVRDVERSHRLATRVVRATAPPFLLEFTYEELLYEHAATLRRVAAFLQLSPAPLLDAHAKGESAETRADTAQEGAAADPDATAAADAHGAHTDTGHMPALARHRTDERDADLVHSAQREGIDAGGGDAAAGVKATAPVVRTAGIAEPGARSAGAARQPAAGVPHRVAIMPALHKATPDRLCEAVINYQQLCEAYLDTDLQKFFIEACDACCNLPWSECLRDGAEAQTLITGESAAGHGAIQAAAGTVNSVGMATSFGRSATLSQRRDETVNGTQMVPAAVSIPQVSVGAAYAPGVGRRRSSRGKAWKK